MTVVQDEAGAMRTGFTRSDAFKWFMNRKADGGLELPAEVVQHGLGHSSITVTLDTYGHLFPCSDDDADLADAEKALIG